MIKFFYNDQTFLYFKLGSLVLDIRWYAVLIMTGAALAYYVSRKNFIKGKYRDLDFFDTVFIMGLWIGIIGARLWYCAFFNFNFYLTHPIHIIRIWDGGLAIQGGIVAGIIFVYWYATKNKYSFLKLCDMIMPNVFLGQCFGRWGNFVNQECHGAEVSEAYFDGVLSFLKNGMHINGHYYEPLFFYESVLCLIGWIIIHFILRKRQNKRGDLAYAYLMWYGVVRYFIEARRTDSLYFGNFKMAMLTSVVFIVIGILGYIGILDKFYKKKKPTVIFDVDGTLIDTKNSIISGFTKCFETFDKVENFTEERKQEVVGPALKEVFPKYFPNNSYDEVYKVYVTAQRKAAATENHPMEGVVEVLEALKENGYNVGIVSSRTHEGIVSLMKDFNFEQYFKDVRGVDEVNNPKPDPEGLYDIIEKNGWNKDVVYIGDTMADVNTAKNYGAYCVAYLSNTKLEDVLKANANIVITDMKDLLEILNKNTVFSYDNL